MAGLWWASWSGVGWAQALFAADERWYEPVQYLDLDGDGLTDALTGDDPAVFYPGSGGPAETLPFSGELGRYLLADVDGDGLKDLVLEDRVLQAPGWTYLGTNECALYEAASADLDHDGRDDVVGQWEYCHSNGADLSLRWLPEPWQGLGLRFDLAVDADGDGDTDIVFTDSLWLDEAGTWTEVAGGEDIARARFSCDLDRDGVVDLLSSGGWQRGRGAGRFDEEVAYDDEGFSFYEACWSYGPESALVNHAGVWRWDVDHVSDWVGLLGTLAETDGDPSTLDVVLDATGTFVTDVLGTPTTHVLSPISSGSDVAHLHLGAGRVAQLANSQVVVQPSDGLGVRWEPVGLLGVGLCRPLDLDADGVDECVAKNAVAHRGTSVLWDAAPIVGNTGYYEPDGAVDIDGDGRREPFWWSTGLSIATFDGAAYELQVLPFDPPDNTGEAAVGDVDGDGDDEVVTLSGNEVLTWHPPGQVVRSTPATPPSAWSTRCEEPALSALVDVDLDGDLDFAHCSALFENVGAGSFTGVAMNHGMFVGDFDLDGDLDSLDDTLAWLERTSSWLPDVVAHPSEFAHTKGRAEPIDLDGDGDLDLLALQRSHQIVLRNLTNAPAIDPDSDGFGPDDNCPDLRNPTQEDTDSDGAGDLCDCERRDPTVRPGATELCDGVLQDCDGVVDAPFDVDGDGYTTCGPDFAFGTDDDDCDDGDAAIPGRNEVTYDGADNDCDPSTPDDDLDEDGAVLAEDCDDENPAVSALAEEVPGDGVDNDCDPATPDDPARPGEGNASGGCSCDDTAGRLGGVQLGLVLLLLRIRRRNR